jgi:hypothetical protein
MIEPESIPLFDLKGRTSSGRLFACYADINYLLYDEGRCIFEIIVGPIEIIVGPINGCYLSMDGGGYQPIEDIFIFLDRIKTEYPEVADWFLFNIKKFT